MATIIGKQCELHPELGGERVASNGRCRACWRAYRRMYQRTHRRGITFGKVCERHPELKGERRSDNCPGCQRDRKRDPEVRKRHRARRDKVKFRQYVKAWRRNNRERYNEGASARSSARRARQRDATGDSAATRRAWRKLRREAKALGMSIDHRVPLKPCKRCGKRGEHHPSNWALLPPELNSRKSNLCMDCYMLDTGSPIIVWRCDTLSEMLSNGHP
jgi:hypothetical protein